MKASDPGPARELRYWAEPAAAVLTALTASVLGLSTEEAARRLRDGGPNRIGSHRELTGMRVFLKQFRNPLLAILIFAAVASGASREWIDASVVLTIVVATVAIGFWREYAAEMTAAALQSRIRTTSRVLRDGQLTNVPIEELAPGDVVLLSAGNLVPADALLLDATELFINEAVLTGESFPVAKTVGTVPADAPLTARTNALFLGTNVRSGRGTCVVVNTGARTEFGRIAAHLLERAPETEFERGLRRFGYFLTSAMLALVLAIVLVHLLGARSPIDTLLFAVALAVGLSPELLPAILAVNLSRGAANLAAHGVLVRRLNAIENLGSIDVLCTDKTGTLTEGAVKLEGAFDADGAESPDVLRAAALNAALQTGLDNPLDAAILDAGRPDLGTVEKLGEIPFDFIRKRLSVAYRTGYRRQLVTKGAFHRVLEACARLADGTPIDSAVQSRLTARYERWSSRGIRVLALATRDLQPDEPCDRASEHDLSFLGFLTFFDRPKSDAPQAIHALAKLGVSVKVISGDSRSVVAHVASLVGIQGARMLSGDEIDATSDDALWRAVDRTDLFVEVDPNQKERIIGALRKGGHVVGFLGDGVNDAPAMRAADTSLSVDGAVDVARATADFVLLEHDLDVIRRGIEEGRRTFANTIKYLLTTMSANLGNMISMAFASTVLPFLPMLPGQILLNNFLSDVPAAGIADDAVDPELVARPERWDLRMIGRFMVVFGLLSSVFDLATFAILAWFFHASPERFRTGWFVESLLTELVVALVVRTRRPFWRSRPGTLLLTSTVLLIGVAIGIPYVPWATFFGFEALPASMVGAIVLLAGCYMLAAELTKQWFFRGRERTTPAAVFGAVGIVG